MEIKKLDIWDLDTGSKGYGESDIDDIKITEENMTAIVKKLNEIIEFINENFKEKI